MGRVRHRKIAGKPAEQEAATAKKEPATGRFVHAVRHEVSAGGLIWRRNPDSGAREMVLVRPAGRDRWVLPKGHVESGESVIAAALREAREESGLVVEAGDSLGDVSYVYTWHDTPGGPLVRIFKRVSFFLMRCVGGDPAAHDDEIEQVEWMSFDEALRRASHQSERGIIEKARAILQD